MLYLAMNGHRAAISRDISLVQSSLPPKKDMKSLPPTDKRCCIHKVTSDWVEGLKLNISEVFPTVFSWKIQVYFGEGFRVFSQAGKDLPYFGVKENGLFFRNESSCAIFKDISGSLPQERITFNSGYFNAIISELKEMGLPSIEIAGNGKNEAARFSLFGDDRVYHYLMPLLSNS